MATTRSRNLVFSLAFALEGTLVVTSDLERTAFRRLCAESVSSAARPIAEVDVDKAYTEHRSALEDGGEALNASIVQAIHAATGGMDSDPRVVAARYRHIAREVAAERATPLPGVERVLDELRRLAVPQAILANGLSSAESRKAQSLGFEGPVLVSEDIGAKKPDPRAFAALAEALMFPAEAIWYVASNFEVDINPAYNLGFNVVWISPETQDLRQSFDSRFHRVRRIDELLELIQEPYTRAMLGVRYIMRSALNWRPGHFIPGVEPDTGD